MKLYYVYVLTSKKDGGFYVGFTSDLKKRLKKHRKEEIQSTSLRRPLNVIFYEVYRNKYDALRR